MTRSSFVVNFISGLLGITIIGGLIAVFIVFKSLNKFAKIYCESK